MEDGRVVAREQGKCAVVEGVGWQKVGVMVGLLVGSCGKCSSYLDR